MLFLGWQGIVTFVGVVAVIVYALYAFGKVVN
jgi:hypothetical protein